MTRILAGRPRLALFCRTPPRPLAGVGPMRPTSPARLFSLTGLVALTACGQASSSTGDELFAAVEAAITTDALDRFASAIVHYERP